MVQRGLENNMQKNENGPLPYAIHKSKFKMEYKPKYEIGSHQNPRGKDRLQPLSLAAATLT